MSRLVLFDIDETMIHSSGCGRRALERALFDVFQRKLTFDGISLSGKTDPQIISEVLHAHGLSDQQCDELLDRIFQRYLPYLEEEVQGAEEYRLHLGVIELLEVLKTKEGTYVGLLTGNIERGARIKLGRFDLNSYFEFGAFGCDSANRMELPAFAHERAKKKFGKPIEKDEIVIIGDAQNDVLCAKGYGAKALAVCTGRTSRESLVELEPHYLFDTLKDTAQVVDAIFAD
jgi:phosphoglycolate phosphatase